MTRAFPSVRAERQRWVAEVRRNDGERIRCVGDTRSQAAQLLAAKLGVRFDALPRLTNGAAPRAGCIYVIESAGLHKIGCSVDAGLRLHSLRMSAAAPCELVGAFRVSDMAEYEAELHALFAPLRTHGEWFRLGTTHLLAIWRAVAHWAWEGMRADLPRRRGERERERTVVTDGESES